MNESNRHTIIMRLVLPRALILYAGPRDETDAG